MSTAKHTPGPWAYRGKNDAVYTAPPAGSPYKYGDFIFRFHNEDGPSGEDLDLILAAPELLQALQSVVAEHGGTRAWASDDPRAIACVAAVAKAMGGAA
jgi:hypothetical protein